MRLIINPGNDLFKEAISSQIYVDKTMLIELINKLINTKQKYICVSRPRRFGKTMAEEMLVAYYSKGCHSNKLFSKLKISQIDSFNKHLNKHNVIYINMQSYTAKIKNSKNVKKLLKIMQDDVITELKEIYKTVKIKDGNLVVALENIYRNTGDKFIFIIDEWDFIFRENEDNIKGQEKYLDYLRGLLKDKVYIELAYMTGILPIKKYGKHSALNMFDEYSIMNQSCFAEFTGFTENEVKVLCNKYNVSFSKMKQWYDDYNVNSVPIYNPRSVIKAVTDRRFDSYWLTTETYEALKFYLMRNEDGLYDSVVRMLAGDKISICSDTFQNDMITLNNVDDVLTLLVHLGYLTYDCDESKVWIPNNEIRKEFINSIKDKKYKYIYKILKQSDDLLKYTLDKNEHKVAEILDEIHRKNTTPLQYNNELSLLYVLLIAYASANDKYVISREVQGGYGFADIIMSPRNNSMPALIIELKWNKSAKTAIKQIKNNRYIECLKDYHGEVLLIGINYNKKTKKHKCLIEKTIV